MLLVIDALVVLVFLLLGVIASRVTSVRYDYAVVSDYLRKRRQESLERYAWNRTVDPLVRMFASVVPKMGLDGHRARVARLLVRAGSPWGYSPEEFIGYGIANAVVACLVTAAVYLLGDRSVQFVVPLVAGAAAYGITFLGLSGRADRRRKLIDRQMPFVLDLVSLTMGAGATFVQACETLTRAHDRGPMEDELDLMLHEMKAGATLRDALKNMTKRSDSEELASMVAAVTQADQLGTPLVEIFQTQASMNRFRRSKAAEKAAAKIPNRMAVPTVFLMLAVLLLLFGPIIVKATRGEMF